MGQPDVQYAEDEMRVRVMVVCGFLGWAGALAAQQSAMSADALLTKIYAYARQYRETVPSLECDEAVVSQWVVKGKVKQEVLLRSQFRELRTENPSSPFADWRHFLSVNGHTPEPVVKLPYLAQAGFANGLGFGLPAEESCYEYTIEPGTQAGTARLNMVARSHDERPLCRNIPEDYRKSVVVEVATGRVLWLQRSMSAKAAKKLKDTPFVEVTYAEESLGDERLLLPVKIVAHDAKAEAWMTATYSNFHRYTAKVTIEGASSVAEP